MGETVLGGERRFVCDQCRAQRKMEPNDTGELRAYYVAAFRGEPLTRATLFARVEVCGVACMTLVVGKLLGAFHRVNGGGEMILSTGALVDRATATATETAKREAS